MENTIPESEQKDIQIEKPRFKFNKKFYLIGFSIILIVIFSFLIKFWSDEDMHQKQMPSKMSAPITHISKPGTPSYAKSVYFLNGTPSSTTPSVQPTIFPVLPPNVTITGVSPSLTKSEVTELISKLVPGNPSNGWTECSISECPFTPRLTTALNTAINYANKIEKVTPSAYTYSPVFREQNSGNPIVESVTSISYGKIDIKMSIGSEDATPEYDLVVLWNGSQWLIDDVLCDGNKSEYHTPYPQTCT